MSKTKNQKTKKNKKNEAGLRSTRLLFVNATVEVHSTVVTHGVIRSGLSIQRLATAF